MVKYMELEIDNSAASAVRGGKWNAPGASFYDQLLNAFHYGGSIPRDAEELNKAIRTGKYTSWMQYLEEAYLIAPIKHIHNSPHGVTPFSRSGCKYPHHVIRGNKLVLSVPGIKAAYSRALQMGVLKGDVKRHLERHIKELGMQVNFKNGSLSWNESFEVKMEENFNDIYTTIMEATGINLFGADYMIIGSAIQNKRMFSEAVIEGTPEHPVLSSDFDKEVGSTTPQALWDWMHKNISYDKDGSKWRLRSAPQLYIDKKGNCHDQSYFASFILHSWGYDNWQLYFVEFKEDSDMGGNSHTLTYYRNDGKYYWFENAWEDQASIHGPYDSKEDIKQAVLDAYAHDYDLNSHEFDGIVFGEHPSYRLGMNLFDYCNSWHLDDDRRFNKDIPKITADIKKSTNPNDPESQEAVDITFFDDKGNKIGEASISSVDTDNAFLYNVEVFEGYRGQGYGKAIIEYCLSHYKVNELTVEPTNTTAIELYKKYGFKKYMDWKENGRKLIDMRRDISDEIKEASSWIDQFVHDEVFRESVSVDTVNDLISKYKTPGELINWMKCIKYAFLDKDGNTIDSDSTNELYKRYRYQSPLQLIRRKKGVCWDCTGLARKWFEKSKYPFCEVYLEIVDDEDCPSHTFIIFKEPGEDMKVNWFESSWDQERGIHQYSDLKTAMYDITERFMKSHGAKPEDTKLFCSSINKGIKYGCTMQEYMDFTHKSFEIDLGDLAYDDVFNESANYLTEEGEDGPPEMPNTEANNQQPEKKESMPKKTDKAESDKNGVRRKKLYIAFIEWCKEYNDKNTFGSIFDEDAFKVSYPFVPHEMRYFYRLANPMLCVLGGELTFFPVAELRKLNSKNSNISQQLIFAATPNDLRVFNCRDKKVYRGTYEAGALKLHETLGATFDTYIQTMIKKGDILNAPMEDNEE